MKKTWSKTLKSIFLVDSFSFSTKRKQSILLIITFLSASSNNTFVISLREKKISYLLSLWEMVPVHEEKSSCINYSVNTITSCTRNLARAPSRRVGSTAGASWHPRLKTEPMLLRDMHNSAHHTQPHSMIVKYMNYLWLNKVLNRRGKLWTCRSAMLRQGVEKSLHWSWSNQYIIHDMFTITFNPENWVL